MADKPILRQFDQVQLLTTKRVKYRSDIPGRDTDPQGVWCVVAFIEGDVLLAKKSALIRIPVNDVKKVASYDPETIIEMLKKVGNYYGQKEQQSKREK